MLVALATFSLQVYLQPGEPPRPEQLFSGLACFNVINNTLSVRSKPPTFPSLV
jgi:hypothetical protein